MQKIILNKATLRRELLAHRQAIAPEVRNEWDASIRNRLIAWSQENPVRTLGIFWPIRGEPDLRPAYAQLAAQGIRLALPVVREKDVPLSFIEWTPGAPMTKDICGVTVPAADSPLQPETLLIPCVGFNTQCFRLGYGGGMFDRTLAVAPRPYALGIGYSCGLAQFEADSHDVALDAVVTETAVVVPT